MLLVACGDRHSTPEAPKTQTAAPPAKIDAAMTRDGKPAWVGTVLHPGDPDDLKRYLASVHEVVPAKFKVEWSPATVAFDRDAAMRSLRAVSQDGRRFTLDPAEAAVAKLVPGSILWIYDVTVSKVERVEHRDGSVIVYTRPVPLNEAIPNGEISFDAHVPLGNYMLGRSAPHTPARTAHSLRARSPFMQVSLTDAGPEQTPASPDANADANSGAADEEQASSDQNSFQGNTYSTTLKGFEIQVGYVPGPNDSMKIRIEARYGDEGGGDSAAPPESADLAKKFKELDNEEKKVRAEIREIRAKMYEAQEGRGTNPIAEGAKHLLEEAIKRKAALDEDKLALKKARSELQDKLWEVLKEAFDARFKMQVDMDGFSAAGDYLFSKGDVEQSKFAIKALNGRAHVKIVARLGDKGTKGVKVPLMDIPLVFNVPMPMGGIPFMLQIGADFNINVFLAGEHAALAVDGEYAFNGNTGFTYSKTSSHYDGAFAATDPGITSYQGLSPGASAVVLGVQLPRIGYGVGLFGMSSMLYFDVVHVLTMTNAASALVGLMRPCKRISYEAVGHIGIETEVLPIPIEAVQAFVKDKLNPKREVFNRKIVVTDPKLKACEIS